MLALLGTLIWWSAMLMLGIIALSFVLYPFIKLFALWVDFTIGREEKQNRKDNERFMAAERLQRSQRSTPTG